MRERLEQRDVFKKFDSLDDVRRIAGELNDGKESLSKLSLEQRRALIDRLIGMGADVKNPIIYDSDLRDEAAKNKIVRS